jgi:hypothetical protein
MQTTPYYRYYLHFFFIVTFLLDNLLYLSSALPLPRVALYDVDFHLYIQSLIFSLHECVNCTLLLALQPLIQYSLGPFLLEKNVFADTDTV